MAIVGWLSEIEEDVVIVAQTLPDEFSADDISEHLDYDEGMNRKIGGALRKLSNRGVIKWNGRRVCGAKIWELTTHWKKEVV